MGKKKDITRAIATVILPPLGYLLMRFYWYTSKKSFHIEGEITQAQGVIVCWHGELLLSPQAYRHIHKTQSASGIISRHFDGEIIARVLNYFHITPLRGSSSRGAKQVLLEAFRSLKKGDDLLVTPDGPRGPRHEVSDGALALAMKGKLPIYAVNFTCGKYWQFGSWDKFVIPKPFSKIDFYIKVLRLDDMKIDEAKVYLTDKMLEHTII
ncbi:lysophospholipid acyltransferase family protein [Sulfurovum sp. zt1-1]|uniref:Lysophospholipid acyltransferase family protein n=1 Tax=Sulfurovum zhangzhouensis TaxID=3019067 RepID=A0ABT7QXA8_9BACT|nr:lysophospholipid acyltransferase family protein [Sulfurovum zhangzhouensis]MDM5271474.1 lysophospholipid acyltransferase family protein [Sulfurovum zhangzhouensis]